MATFQDKFAISLGSALLFYLVNSPAVYNLTSQLTGMVLFEDGCPTNLGIVLHTMVFFSITYAMSSSKSSSYSGMRLKHAIWGTLIFFMVSNPTIYSFVASLLGHRIATPEGCPTPTGLLVHTMVFCFALVGVMYLPKK